MLLKACNYVCEFFLNIFTYAIYVVIMSSNAMKKSHCRVCSRMRVKVFDSYTLFFLHPGPTSLIVGNLSRVIRSCKCISVISGGRWSLGLFRIPYTRVRYHNTTGWVSSKRIFPELHYLRKYAITLDSLSIDIWTVELLDSWHWGRFKPLRDIDINRLFEGVKKINKEK